MAKILVHITHGPDNPTRSVLGLHVAKAAIDEGHSVTIFLAGDGVQLMRDGVIEHMNGLGTGNLKSIYESIAESNVKIYMSGMSSKTRGLTEKELEGKNYEFAGPPQLVRLAVEHDRMFSY